MRTKVAKQARHFSATVYDGGFEGPKKVYPPTPDQIPKVILVDGVAVEPRIDLPENSLPPTDSDPTPKEADKQEG